MGVVRFADVVLDLDAMELRRGGEPVALQRRSMDLLRYLIDHADRVVEKGELFQAVWSGSVVSESALTQAVKQVRRAVGDDGAAQLIVQTVRGRGYRFVAEKTHDDAPTRTIVAEPFVGREALLREALLGWETAASGAGRALLLVGEAGIGKTRAAREIVARIEAEGARALVGRCFEGGAAPAYWPFVRALSSLERLDVPAASADAVARAIPELAAKLPRGAEKPPAPPSGVDAEGERFVLFDALATALREEAGRGPLVVFLDDLHLADLASLRLLEFILREVERAPVFFVLTSREAELRADPERARFLGSVGRTPGARVQALAGLSAAEVGQYVELRTGRTTPSGRVASLHRRSGGNPFFLTQLVATGGTFDADDQLPASTREAIALHLDVLPKACRRALGAASVLGQRFEIALVARQQETQPEVVARELAPALAAGVLEERDASGGEYQFCHGLIHEACYEGLDLLERGELHARAGRAIEAIHSGDDARLPELALHFTRAPSSADAVLAVRYSALAGERAAEALAFEEAAEHFERALAVGPRAAIEPPERLALLLAHGDALIGCANYGASRETLLRARDLARHLGDRAALARAALGYAAEGEALSPDDERIALLEEALEALGSEVRSLRIRLLARLSEALYFTTSRGRAQELSLEAVRLARESGDPADLLFALRRRHFSVFDADHLDERLVLVEEMLEEADRLGAPLERLAARGSLIDDLVEAGDAARVFQEIETYRHEADLLRQPQHQWWATMHRGMVHHLRGEFEAAEEAIEEGYALGLETHGVLAPIWYLCQLWGLRRDQGRVAELGEVVQQAALRYPESPWRHGVTHIHMLNGEHDVARAQLEAHMRNDFAAVRRDINWLISLVVMSDVAVGLGDRDAAEQLYRALIPYARQSVVVGQAASYTGCASRYLGRLSIVLERFDAAERHLDFALERERVFGSAPNVAEVQASLAELMLRRGDASSRSAAAGYLDEASETAAHVGMPHLIGRLNALRGALEAPYIGRRDGL